jgi:polyhydroxyalkanoate synthesis repressor PhaR
VQARLTWLILRPQHSRGLCSDMTDKSKKNDPQSSVIKIKKYANRRLYNMQTSSYVTLEDLGKMVKSNQEFVVVDAKTGADLTQTILTQIIFEEEAKGQSLLPSSFLRQLIQLYGHALQGVVPSYLEQSMKMFTAQQENLYKAFGANPTMANLSQMTQANMDAFKKAMNVFMPFDLQNSENDFQKNSEDDVDIDKIQKQLAELKDQLKNLKK